MSAPTAASNATHFGAPPDYSSRLFEAKARKGLTFEQIANHLGKGEVWVAAAFYGQAKFTPEELRKLLDLLELEDDIMVASSDQWWPHRGLGPMPPTDPVLYRFYEGLLVYGNAIKAVIHEKSGDGIVSMIDCQVNIETKQDPKGDRLVVSFDGKFLPYAKW